MKGVIRMAKTQKAKAKPRAKAGQAGSQQAKKTRRPGELSRFQKIVVVIFIVVFALSTLAGALASVFQSQNQSVEYNVDYIDSQFEGTVADLENTVSQNPEDSASLLQLANDYYSWGTYVSALATTDDETSHGLDLFSKAVDAYDRYLALAGDDTSSDDVNGSRVSRAMCLYYQGETSDALSALEELTQSSEDFSYAPAWADLGLLYEREGSTDEAIAAYQRAIECDPDDEAGAKSYAEGRLEALQPSDDSASDDGSADDGSADADDSGSADAADGSASGAESLSEDLSDAAGTGL